MLLGCRKTKPWKLRKLENVKKLSTAFANTEVDMLLDIHIEIHRHNWVFGVQEIK